MTRSLRVAVVGSGPAGMYAVESLLEQAGCPVEVDVFERLPSPWGLVRAGVAPDHPDKKQVIDRLFHYYLNRREVSYFGNVEIGSDIRPAELADWYDAVIYATGAGGDTRLGIPGEELPGCWGAREFVAWYNGHPEYAGLDFDLSCQRAVIVGNGNVALDVARILTLPVSVLEATDIADHALDALRQSRISEVVILGRRAHFQGAFNNPELEELGNLDDVRIVVDGDDFPAANDVVLDGADWLTERKIATLKALADRTLSQVRKRILFRFLASPIELLGNGKVEQMLGVHNHLEHYNSGQLRARATEKEFLLDTGLVLRAIGYRGYPFPGLPFDDRLGVISNREGRVVDGDSAVPGVYVTGWIKRGARGIIGTNKKCARETVACLLDDHARRLLAPATRDRQAVVSELATRKPDWVDATGWQRIDRTERLAGLPRQRPRVKITDLKQMLETAG